MSLIEIRSQLETLKKEYSESQDACKSQDLLIKIKSLQNQYLNALCALKKPKTIIGYYVSKIKTSWQHLKGISSGN